MDNSVQAAAEIRYQYICEAYQVMCELASGEDGRTLLAKRTADGSPVIEKILSSSQGLVYERLKGLHHPNVAPVLDVVYHEGQSIVIMEYVGGTTLQGMLKQRGYLNAQEAVEIVVQLLNGLEFLHDLGLVHRDIHPGNVLVSSDNVVKILDLGIARRVREKASQDTSILGTVGFAAPEQYGFAQTDGRTDIYSVGVLLNVLLTGRVPSVVTAQGRLGQIILRCIEIAPEKRYEDVKSLREDLLKLKRDAWIKRPEQSCPDKGSDRVNRLPGFRTGKLWKQLIAVTGYGIMALVTVTMVVDAGMKKGILGVLLELMAMLMVFWIPYAFFTNIGSWDRRIFPFRKWDKDVMIAVRIIVPILLIYGGMMLDTFARTP